MPTLPHERAIEIIDNVRTCHELANETVDLTKSTLDTGSQLVECGNEIKDCLLATVGLEDDDNDGNDGGEEERRVLSSETLSVIADLIDGDKPREARELASAMKVQSSECVSKCVELTQALDAAVESLPSWVEEWIEHKTEDNERYEASEEQEALCEVEGTVRALEQCAAAIGELKLVSAVRAGTDAYRGISRAAARCREIFAVMAQFAVSVATLTDSILDLDVKEVLAKLRDILRAVALAGFMKRLAQACDRVVDAMLALFQMTAGKLARLWKALSNAKDVMLASLHNVCHAKDLCQLGADHLATLRDSSRLLGDKLDQVQDLRPAVWRDLKDLKDGDYFDDVLATAATLDDVLTEAAQDMHQAALLVMDGYQNLPPIITDGITDAIDQLQADAQDHEDDVLLKEITVDVEPDAQQIQTSTETIQSSELLQVTKTSYQQFQQLFPKIDTLTSMNRSCLSFADQSQSCITLFLERPWTMDTSLQNIIQMCRMVKLAEGIVLFATQIQRLIDLLKTFWECIRTKVDEILDKFDLVPDALEDIIDDVGDFVEGGLDKFKDLFR